MLKSHLFVFPSCLLQNCIININLFTVIESNQVKTSFENKPFQNNFFNCTGDKFGKATGLDDIRVEVWKTNALPEPLLDVCNKTFYGDKPIIWQKSCLKVLPKKRDLANAGNYCGICLNTIASKVYKIILFIQRTRSQ